MCSVATVVGFDPRGDIVPDVHEALFAMQHRGQESSRLYCLTRRSGIKAAGGEGLVTTAYSPEDFDRLVGSVALGGNRYSTNGSKSNSHSSYFDPAIDFAFAMNGNLPVVKKLDRSLEKRGVNTKKINDAEKAGMVIAELIRKGHALPDAVERAFPLMEGAHSSVAMHDGMAVGFRSAVGIRPLAYGISDNSRAITSETCGLDIFNANYEREVRPGEMMILTNDGMETRQLAEGIDKLDMFELVYFARHDSLLYGKRVYLYRRGFGKQLALEHPPDPSIIPEDEWDKILVVPIPDTSIPSAEGYAHELGLEMAQAVIKNRYVGRLFIHPNDVARRKQHKRKHTNIPELLRGRHVIFIDDSIVRLDTAPKIIAQGRDAGALSVTFLSTSPPVAWPDFYGIDTARQSELTAANFNLRQIQRKSGADYLGYLSLDGLVGSTGIASDKFNLSPFNGDYPINIGRNKRKVHTPEFYRQAA